MKYTYPVLHEMILDRLTELARDSASFGPLVHAWVVGDLLDMEAKGRIDQSLKLRHVTYMFYFKDGQSKALVRSYPWEMSLTAFDEPFTSTEEQLLAELSALFEGVRRACAGETI